MLPLLHGAGPITWRSWEAEPTILLGALVSTGLYAYGLRTVLRSGAVDPRTALLRAASFAAGVALMLVALLSPIDAATEELLSMHMLQHMIIGSLAPPLLLLGLPPELLERLGLSSRLAASAMRLFANPFFAGGIFIANLWVWHAPPLYELALDHLAVHIEMHLAFITAGLLFWWPVIDPARERTAMSPGGKMLFLFLASFPMGVLALLLLSAQDIIYSPYASTERIWGISPLADQQIAGVLMGAVGETASFVAFTLLFFQIFSEGEPEERQAGQLPRVS